jgi:hypothetical protein
LLPSGASQPAEFTFAELFAGIGGFRLALEELGGRCTFVSEIEKEASDVYRHNFSGGKEEPGVVHVGDITEVETTAEDGGGDSGGGSGGDSGETKDTENTAQCAATSQGVATAQGAATAQATASTATGGKGGGSNGGNGGSTVVKVPSFDFLTAGFPCQSFSRSGNEQGLTDARGALFFEVTRFLHARTPATFLLENVRRRGEKRCGREVEARTCRVCSVCCCIVLYVVRQGRGKEMDLLLLLLVLCIVAV